MFEHANNGKISIERIVEKMVHNPAILFRIEKRGYIREGYFADLVVVEPNSGETVNTDNILYQCGWSPFEGNTFKGSIEKTLLNGQWAYDQGKINPKSAAMALTFDR